LGKDEVGRKTKERNETYKIRFPKSLSNSEQLLASGSSDAEVLRGGDASDPDNANPRNEGEKIRFDASGREGREKALRRMRLGRKEVGWVWTYKSVQAMKGLGLGLSSVTGGRPAMTGSMK